MKKSVLLGAAICILFSGFPKILPAEDWYVGGTLYRATVRQWQRASYENKLATAAFWALMQPDVRRVGRKSSTMNTIKPYAEELVGCIDRVSFGGNYVEKNVSGLAAACMVLKGW